MSYFSNPKRPVTPTSMVHNNCMNYPTPANISYFWSLGSLSAFCLVIQLVSGVFLAMHYDPSMENAFASVEHIMRDVKGGWFMKYLHSNGASAFFAVVYIHIMKALLYNGFAYTNRTVWLTGFVIFILMMCTAFLGYILPWGQMSLWGATVITNLFSVVPYIGNDLVNWIWGGFSVGGATLNRFYSLHYLFPFLMIAFVALHIFYLHKEGSSNPFAAGEYRDTSTFFVPLYPSFFVKDLLGFSMFILMFSEFLFFAPNALGHPDNYIEANSMVTPEHIVPEWYFLPFYAILRSIPDKTFGIIAMGGALMILPLLTLESYMISSGGISLNSRFIMCKNPRSSHSVHLFSQLHVVSLVTVFVLLGIVGSLPVAEPYITLGQYLTGLYFVLIMGLMIPSISIIASCPLQ